LAAPWLKTVLDESSFAMSWQFDVCSLLAKCFKKLKTFHTLNNVL